MRAVKNPVSLILLAVALIGIAFSNWALVALAGLPWAIFMSLSVMRSTQTRRNELAVGEGLRPESQALLKPIRKLAQDMRQMVGSKPAGSAVSLVGKDVLEESDRVVSQCAASLAARDDLKRLLRGKYDAEREIERVREAMSGATSDGERQAMENTLSARLTEQGHYAQIEATVAKIDTGLRQAEAALAEMKARLALSASTSGAADDSAAELRDSLLRIKAVTLSVDEAEQLING